MESLDDTLAIGHSKTNLRITILRVASEKVEVYADCDAIGIEIFHIKSNSK